MKKQWGKLLIAILLVSCFMSAAKAAGEDEVDTGDDAQAVHLRKHVKKLELMEADRELENEHTRQAQEEFRNGTAEMTGHADQQAKDIQDLKSAENQVTAGKKQRALAHQSYKNTVQKYGFADPKSAVARQNWKQSRQAMGPLVQSRRSLKADVYHGGLVVHNEKTVLSVQKMRMDSDARYRAMDDRSITKEEKNIADAQRAMTTNIASSRNR